MDLRIVTIDEYVKELGQKFEIFNTIFLEKGINWFALGGTLIGSIRYNGQIPWDDDFDMGIKTSDFNTHVQDIEKIAKDNNFYLVRKDKSLTAFCSKLMSYETVGIEFNGKIYETNFFIDIYHHFPVKSTNKFRDKYISAFNKTTFIFTNFWKPLPEYKLQDWKPVKISPLIQILVWIGRIFVLIPIWIMFIFEKRRISSNEVGTLYSIHDKTTTKDKYLMPNELIEHKFNDSNILIPKNYEQILVNQYGPNYLEEPSKDKQIPTHFFNFNWYKKAHSKRIKKESKK